MINSTFAANKNVGTTGAQFLKIGAGPRPTAMGNAFVGLADDVNAVYFNPAGLSYLDKPQILGMHTQWFQDINYNFGAFSYPTDWGSFALSAQTLSIDEIQRRGNDEAHLGDFDAADAAYALSYARYLGPQLSLGLTGRYIKQEIDSVSATTYSGDIGILKRFGRLPLSMGIMAKHFGQEVEFRNESDPLPFSLDVGFGADLYREKLKLALDASFPRDNDASYRIGTEYNQRITRNIGLSGRIGFNTAATDEDGASGLAFGGGVRINKVHIDMAWVPFGDLGNTLRTSVLFKF